MLGVNLSGGSKDERKYKNLKLFDFFVRGYQRQNGQENLYVLLFIEQLEKVNVREERKQEN